LELMHDKPTTKFAFELAMAGACWEGKLLYKEKKQHWKIFTP